jgi:HEAT repeat protein
MNKRFAFVIVTYFFFFLIFLLWSNRLLAKDDVRSWNLIYIKKLKGSHEWYYISQNNPPTSPVLIEEVKGMNNDELMNKEIIEGRDKIEKKCAISALIEILKDTNYEVRQHAAHALGRIGSEAKAAVPALIEALKDEDQNVRNNAAWALGNIGVEAKDAVPTIIEILRKAEDEKVIWNAAIALYHIEPENQSVIPVFIKAVKDDKRVIRLNAIHFLGSIGSEAKDAVPALIEAIEDKDKMVRRSAIDALGGIGAEAENAVFALTKSLKDKDRNIQLSAVNALVRIAPKDKSPIQALEEALNDEERDRDVRISIANAIVLLGGELKNPVPILIEMLRHPDRIIRLTSAQKLSILGSYKDISAAVEPLIDLLKDEDQELRMRAAMALGRIRAQPEKVMPALVKALNNNDNRDVRRSIANAISEFGSEAISAVDPLIKMLKNTDWEYREDAALTLGTIGPEARAAVPELIKALNNKNEKNWKVRRMAAISLGKISEDEKSVKALIKALWNDDHAEVRSNAAMALGRFGLRDKAIISDLQKKALNDTDNDVRRNATLSLGQLGAEARTAIGDLTKILKDQDISVSSSAAKALTFIARDLKNKTTSLSSKDLKKIIRDLENASLKMEALNLQNEAFMDSLNVIKYKYERRKKEIDIIKYFIYFICLLLISPIFVFLAIPFASIRKFILHPVGSAVIGIVVGKYLLIDPLIRFIRPIKIALFRDYRKQLQAAPAIKSWKNHPYVPPCIELPNQDTCSSKQEEQSEENEQWKKVLKTILTHSEQRLWLCLGKSGLGKTALLEKWTDYALSLNTTPLFIPLGSDLSPQQEAAASMAQYGDIDIKPEVAFDWLKSGGFLLLLDGFNEDHTPAATREFVRHVSKRNHIVMTSQIDPQWDKMLSVCYVKLEPFGENQLSQIMDKEWVEKLMNAKHFSDMAQLPQTAQLLADFIKDNNTLPDFRLDIYRNLRRNFEDDTQILNLERQAWELYKINSKPFEPDVRVSKQLCEGAVREGILTKSGNNYQFRHERIHRYFVASYLYRQEQQPLIQWHKELDKGLGRDYWIDTLELWGEMYAENAGKHKATAHSYFKFLEDCAEFNVKTFADRLHPQIEKLYETNVLKRNTEFDNKVSKILAKAVAA